MDKKIKFIIFILFLPLFFYGRGFAFGQAGSVNGEINDLNQKIQDSKDKIKKIQDQQAAYAKAIQDKQNEGADLENQLSILDNRLAKAELDISSTQIEMERTNLEIDKTDLEISDTNDQIEKQKEQIAAALRLIYKQDDVSTLEILLLNNSLTEFLNQAKYLEDVNKSLEDSLAGLKVNMDDLEKEKQALTDKQKELAGLKQDFEDKKTAYESDKESKNILLEETHDSERQYQDLLARAKREQRAAEADISNMERLVRSKMSQATERKLDQNENGLIWPVPKNTITAYFHDPNYPFRYVFEHPAIDIRARQGTPIKAAASGYVARAKDGGMGYSYIMLVHGDGLSTVYGHVSKILVKEDDYVVQGQIIGLSGGLPGTPGAGPLTTGSHLHFEVRSNGIPVNPLDYLP